MSLPEEMLDELLSAYLDGAVSDDERARVEQLLADNREVAERFESLRTAVQATRDAKLTDITLPSDFAERTVQAAIDQAAKQSLPEEHPLQRAAQRSSVVGPSDSIAAHERSEQPHASSDWNRPRMFAAMIAIAASLLIAGFALKFAVDQSGDEVRGDGERVASADLKKRDATADENGLPDRSDSSAAASETEMIARSELTPEQRDPEGSAADPSTLLAEADADQSPSANGSPDVNAEAAMPPSTRIADAGTDSTVRSPNASNVDDASMQKSPALRLRSLLIVDVQLSDSGRDSDAFAATLEKAGIKIGEEREVDAALASTVRREKANGEGFPENTEVMLLQAPTKKLASLGDFLATNREAFPSVRLSLVFDPPVLRAIESVRVDDPKTIQHNGQGHPLLVSDPEIFQQFGETLIGGPFAPLDSSTSQMLGSASPAEDGSNPMSQMLILVR